MIGKARKGITPIIAVVLLIVIAFVAVGAVGTLVTGVIDDVEVGNVGPQGEITGMESNTTAGTDYVGIQLNPTGESLQGEYEVRIDEGDGEKTSEFINVSDGSALETKEIAISGRTTIPIKKEWPSDQAPTSFTVIIENVESGAVIEGSCQLNNPGDEVC